MIKRDAPTSSIPSSSSDSSNSSQFSFSTTTFQDALEVDQIVKFLSSSDDDNDNDDDLFNLKVFCKLFALDGVENNLLENVETNEKHIRDIESTVFEFTKVESEDDSSNSEEEEDDEEDEEEEDEEDHSDDDESEDPEGENSNNRRSAGDQEDSSSEDGDGESSSSDITSEQVESLITEIKNEIQQEKLMTAMAASSNNDDENESKRKNQEAEDYDFLIRREPTSSKLNILNLSTLSYPKYEHPDRFEVRNIMYFSKVTLCKLFKERKFIGISEIIDTFYSKNREKKKVQLPNFVLFQILFTIIEKMHEMDERGLMKKIPNIEQDEHLFHLYRNRHVEKYHVIERLFLDNIEISPKFKPVDLELQDRVGKSQFVDVNISDNFEKLIQDLSLCESDIVFCLGIFIWEVIFSTTSASTMIYKILSQPYNEPLICQTILQDNRANWCLIRIILSMLRINEPYRLVPKPFYEKETNVENAHFIPRITLENLIGIEMAHVCTILSEDRKVFECFTVPFLIKFTVDPPQPDMLNNPLFHSSSSSNKYMATTTNNTESESGGEKKIDLLYSFFCGIILYGSKKMADADKYLRQSVLHPNLENDSHAKSILDRLGNLDDLKENASNIVEQVANLCKENSFTLQHDITERFATARTKLPFFAYVSYSFLGKALAEMKKYPLSLYYTEYSFVCSQLQQQQQQTENSPIFNSSALFTKAYIVHKYDIFDISSHLYEQVTSNYRGHSMAHNNRGICLKRLKANQDAINEYELSLRIDPSNHLAYNNRAMYFYSDDEYENSMLYYKMAIRLKPTYHLPITNLGLTYTQLNKFTEAIELLSKVLVWAPSNANALITRGFCHMRKNNFEDALADYSKLVNELESEERSTLFNMSLCFYHTNRYKEAIYYTTKIITKNPHDDRAHYYRSLYYEKCNKYEEAFDDINVFLEFSPANPAGTILRDRLLNVVKRITRIS